ncbi:flagellar brake protein [Alkaliphilus peptidifermentans]|uniref:PilZ domain-containing protein n=1 Tax=Alkaliphilus peptidifermentans DSM 18978 TaxID=1120976 RepID=A0A1G5G9P5_9FIRM|nr:PilZ domain-containing protein [Alkaliphilus peptidifermentans]SCY48285.1 PilZ domain-containing protein [Alkaliphilus peptidifermentans DSM 18978]
MSGAFISKDAAIKLEIDVIPPYLSFWGKIHLVDKKFFVVKIDGKYVQNEPRKVKCTIPNEKKVCVINSTIHGFENDLLFIEIPSNNNIEILQRRKYVRIAVDKEVECYLIGINDRRVENTKFFPATLKDISGGGVLLNTSLSIPIGTVIVFELDINGASILLTCKVLRNTENENNQSRNIGCEFIALSDNDRQRIISYCSKEQLKHKRK